MRASCSALCSHNSCAQGRRSRRRDGIAAQFLAGNAAVICGAIVGLGELTEDIRWNTTEFSGIPSARTVMDSFKLVIHAVTFGTSRTICVHPRRGNVNVLCRPATWLIGAPIASQPLRRRQSPGETPWGR
jgi:hypothetical protein